MKLSDLIKTSKAEIIDILYPGDKSVRKNDYRIDSICANSNDAKPGCLFAAIKGFKADGNDYIREAIQKGAETIVSEKIIKDCEVPLILVKNARKALSRISALFFDNPSEHLFLTGVTGTNGKTTVTYLIENILKTAGKNAGVIGTVNIRYNGNEIAASFTTPESVDLQRILSIMRENSATHVVMEVTSHAIDLLRIEDCLFDISVFTNLTQDHLDYHKNMAAYWECKKKLFTKHLTKGSKKDTATAVINMNNRYGKELYDTVVTKKISVGISGDNFINAESAEYSVEGIKTVLRIDGKKFKMESPLIGKHNLENILCAAGAAAASGIASEDIIRSIANTRNIPGRLERIENRAGRHIFIDYAHTPDALENVLSTLKEIGSRRLISVFGCGGDRDKTKRPLMGKIAGRLSDLCVITSDNPRSENPNRIIEQIAAGVKTETDNFIIEPDRKKGIEAGINELKKEDILLIAGKGHETYQIIGEKKFDFDDRKIAEQILNR